jgi:2-polyprenyl-3-methyl-5-hydroxy-6-metoxy-1,4-benzoquinol methylase
MKILVAIASYGTNNDRYLNQLVSEYRSMPFEVDIVVLSNIAKPAGPSVEVVVVDLEGKNPWSLPFPHKQIFADRKNDYDLFLYSEDDTLVTEKNIRAFVEVSTALPEGEIPGFLRFEQNPDGSKNFPEIHGRFYWDSQSVRSRGGYTLAHFTNEHAACYLLTRSQLEGAIQSGGFLVGPHQHNYDLLCTAATDAYTQCGFKKLICISRIDEFLIHHLPNKYVGTSFGIGEAEFQRQLEALVRVGSNGHRPIKLFETETKLRDGAFSKSYYEPVRAELLKAIPSTARNVLSIGCGSGETEEALVKRGMNVVGLPLDEVIAGAAAARGVKIVTGDFEQAHQKLAGIQFDVLLLSNVLHLVREPAKILKSFADVLTRDAVVLVSTPNFKSAPILWRKFRRSEQLEALDSYESSGVRMTSHDEVRSWLRAAGLKPDKTFNIFSPRGGSLNRYSLGLMDEFLSTEFIAVARKDQGN